MINTWENVLLKGITWSTGSILDLGALFCKEYTKKKLIASTGTNWKQNWGEHFEHIIAFYNNFISHIE